MTIEDVVFVIDTCRVKENSYDDVSDFVICRISGYFNDLVLNSRGFTGKSDERLAGRVY